MEDLLKAISTVGFPIAVATYCLIYLNKTIQENTKIVGDLKSTLEILLSRGDK